MAKLKTKKVPYDTTATEVRPGVWQWEVDKVKWEFNPQMPLNTQMCVGCSALGMVHSENLKEAAVFSQGYMGGYLAGKGAPQTKDDPQVSGVETRKPVTVTAQQLYEYLRCCDAVTIDSYQEFLTEGDWDDETKPPITEELFNALRACTVKNVVNGKEMSCEHLGGDDVCNFITETVKATDEGFKIVVWYGDAAEVLVAGFKPEELNVVEAPYITQGELDRADEEDDD